MYPADYYYTKDHEWIKRDSSNAIVGITTYAQKELGDIVYVELPPTGKKFQSGDPFGTIESVKAVSEIYAPVSMEILEVNEKVVQQPETINKDAHSEGWLVKVKVANEADFESLLSAKEYEELISKH